MHNSSKNICQNVQGGLKTLYKNKAITSFFLKHNKINYDTTTKLIVNVSCNGRNHIEKLIIPSLKTIRKRYRLEHDGYHVDYNRIRCLKSYNTKCIIRVDGQSGNLKELYYY